MAGIGPIALPGSQLLKMLMRESQKIIFAASVLNHDGHWYAKFGCPASMLPPKKNRQVRPAADLLLNQSH